MKPGLPLVIFLSCLAFLSCEKNLDMEADYPIDSFYFNSFERSSDTVGWYGIYENSIVEEAPKLGGRYSLVVSGGCIVPHAYYQFATLTEDCNLILKCWGKNLSNGGSLSLYMEDHPDRVHISVSEASWTKYISEDTLHCAAGSVLVLELNSGGIISSAMLVDQIEITEVD